MCGIFGAIAKDGKVININKVKVLGLYNIQRGQHSCGYYWSGNIDKGIDENKNFSDWVVKKPPVRGELPCEIFMGHTRQATNGKHDYMNAHPHRVDDYVQTHNGTLKNHYALCKKYDIDTKDLNLDSIMLANIIKARGFDVLNHYEGAAALSMTFMADPNTLYLYHGASKEFSHKAPEEERPLFYVKAPEGLYYSSIYNSLKFITENKYDIIELPHNGVYKIQNGGETIENVYKVNREEANVSKWNLPAVVGNTLFGKSYQQQLKDKFKATHTTTQISPDAPSLWRESYPMEGITIGSVFYRFGRYFKSGDFNEKDLLLNGVYVIDRDGKMLKDGEKSERLSDTYYFIKGIMISVKKHYNNILASHPDVLTMENISFYLSKYSRYPITPLKTETTPPFTSHCSTWWKDEKKFRGSCIPKFTKRKYNIKDGILQTVTKATNEEVIFLDPKHFIEEYKIDNAPVKIVGFEMNSQSDLFDKTLPVKTTEYYDNATKSWGIFDSKGNLLSTSDKKAEDEETKKLLEKIEMNNVVATVKQWSNMVIIKEKIKELPESFIMLIDHIICKIYEAEKGITYISDGEIDRLTTQYLLDMVKEGKTLHDTLITEEEYLPMLDFSYIKDVMDEYSLEDLLGVKNRYEFIKFEEDVDEDVKKDSDSLEIDAVKSHNANTECRERCNLLIDQFKQLLKSADNFQEIDASDSAQDIAFDLYQQIGIMKRMIESTLVKYKYTDLIVQFSEIKC